MGARFPRRLAIWLWTVVSMLACTLAGAPDSNAQAYPARPVTIIVPFGPGSGNDVIARIVAQKVSENWGNPVVVDNRPGASGAIGMEVTARAAPDAHTIVIASTSHIVNQFVSKVRYDMLKDFAPVGLINYVPYGLVVTPGLPANTMRELIDLARGAPGKFNVASPGVGTPNHLGAAQLMALTGIELVHVPYKVIGQTTADLLSGQVSLWFPTMPGVMQHIKGGRMTALGVSGSRRAPALPNVPTIAEAGVPGYDASTWYPLLAPAGTPSAIVDKLNAQLVIILAMPDVREKLQAQGIEPVGSSPAQLSMHLKSELVKWEKVVRMSGAKVD